jgi:hypothetical protein
MDENWRNYRFGIGPDRLVLTIFLFREKQFIRAYRSVLQENRDGPDS